MQSNYKHWINSDRSHVECQTFYGLQLQSLCDTPFSPYKCFVIHTFALKKMIGNRLVLNEPNGILFEKSVVSDSFRTNLPTFFTKPQIFTQMNFISNVFTSLCWFFNFGLFQLQTDKVGKFSLWNVNLFAWKIISAARWLQIREFRKVLCHFEKRSFVASMQHTGLHWRQHQTLCLRNQSIDASTSMVSLCGVWGD